MRVLIAEDERVSRHMLEAFLTKLGYEVVVAGDGREAWQVLQQDDAPKLAILDWMMPGMEGVQVCQRLRERKRLPNRFRFDERMQTRIRQCAIFIPQF